MTHTSYDQFCPVAMAAEVLCTRWTMLVVRDLVFGARRFNELRRGVPRMSPALLAKRLKELEEAGIVRRIVAAGAVEYRLTEAGGALRPLVEAMGMWGRHWIDATASLEKLDPARLMWDICLRIDPTPAPERRSVIQFRFPKLTKAWGNYWLIIDPDRTVDLCVTDPGFDVDLFATADLRSLTAVWLCASSPAAARREGTLAFVGDPALADRMCRWLEQSPFSVGRQPHFADAAH